MSPRDPYGRHFTPDEVREIRTYAAKERERGMPVRTTESELARQHDCSEKTIQRMVQRKTYRKIKQGDSK